MAIIGCLGNDIEIDLHRHPLTLELQTLQESGDRAPLGDIGPGAAPVGCALEQILHMLPDGRGDMVLDALLGFVFRELLAILTAPVAARLSPYLPIYLGGATSMDVMLPFVQRYSGRDYTLVSFYSGIVCSLAVLPLVRIIL